MANQKKKKPLLVGITGGIGAGKSAFSKILENAGYTVLNADQFARAVTQVGSPALKKIAQLFGKEALLKDGSLNRAYIRGEIIRDSNLREKLEAITHPKIQELTLAESKRLFKEGKTIVFYEAPLLFEAKSEKNMDLVICVVANDKIRIKRVMARDNSNEEDAKKILESQMNQELKAKKSDYVVTNDGDLNHLKKQADEILLKIQG